MTTIAWTNGQVAADSQVSYGICRGAGAATKLKRKGNVVYACTGTAPLFDPMIKWVEDGADPEKRPKISDEKATTLLVFRDGKCFAYRTDVPYPEEMSAPDAWGSGAEFAIGAMRAGASPAQAVEIAIVCDVHSGGPVQVIDLQSLVECERNAA